MCYFLFVAVQEHALDSFSEELVRRGFSSIETQNRTIRSAFPRECRVCLVTRGGCSCDLRATHGAPFDEAAEKQKLSRKGWSEAKIARAIQGRRPSLGPWLAQLRDTLAATVRDGGKPSLFGKWFSGDPETEMVDVATVRTLSLAEYFSSTAALEEGVVYQLVEAAPVAP